MDAAGARPSRVPVNDAGLQGLAVDGGRVWACVGQEVVVWGRPAVGIGGRKSESNTGSAGDGALEATSLSNLDDDAGASIIPFCNEKGVDDELANLNIAGY